MTLNNLTKNCVIPHNMLPVKYCKNIWWMLYTLPRSTRHSAVSFPLDSVHCPSLFGGCAFRPSTARSAPTFLRSRYGCFCHAGLFKARFSVEKNKKKTNNYVSRLVSLDLYFIDIVLSIKLKIIFLLKTE